MRFRGQTDTSIPQQNYFTGKVEQYDGATMFFIAEKQQENLLDFYLDLLFLPE